jgi:hypothetical protein
VRAWPELTALPEPSTTRRWVARDGDFGRHAFACPCLVGWRRRDRANHGDLEAIDTFVASWGGCFDEEKPTTYVYGARRMIWAFGCLVSATPRGCCSGIAVSLGAFGSL